jgi:YHS domain-containing protein
MTENMKQGLVIGLSVMVGFAVALFLQQSGVLNLNPPGSVTVQEQTPVEVGNKHCPVTGNPVNAMGGPIKHLYNGKIYNLCCGMCPRTFDSKPAFYAKIAEGEVKGQAH